MSNIKKLRKLKNQWKILLSAMLVIFVFGGYIFAKADSSVTVSVTTTATIVNQGTESNSIIGNYVGKR